MAFLLRLLCLLLSLLIHKINAENCVCVDQKIWYDHAFGERPDIDLVLEDMESAGEPDEHKPCLAQFDMPNHKKVLEYFYSRHCTQFVPQQTGDYTFFMACDNTCTLFVLGNRVLTLNRYTKYQEWDRYPANQTVVVSLTAGKCSEVCAVQAEGKGSDHVTIGIQYPDGTIDRPMSKDMCSVCPCSSGPCLNGGTCSNTGQASDGFSCECAQCYSGDSCEIQEDPCTSNPCQNGGTCIRNATSPGCYTCECPSCYSGDNCENEENKCDDNTCQNGGTCFFDEDEASCYTCECPNCYSGDNCEIGEDPCFNNNPCLNGGMCMEDRKDPNCYTCICPACYSGQNCENETSQCDASTCQNGGTCIFDENEAPCYRCQCANCYSGYDCEIADDACANNSCQNGGTCRNDATSPNCYTCECPSCYSGNNCENEIDSCDAGTCQNGATCFFDEDEVSCYTCECADCYSGDNCEKQDDPCDNNPCQNGGTCTNDASAPGCYSCQCPSCYSGDNCENEPCDSDPCNGATCTNKPDTPECYECEAIGCSDIDDDCETRCNEPVLSNDQLIELTKKCRKSCGFCCSCEGHCEVMFMKKGCWTDKSNQALPNLLINERDKSSPKYQQGFPGWDKWNTFLPEFVCRCAKEAVKAGYQYFGIQYFSECWGGNADYNNFGQNTKCIGKAWKSCTWPSKAEEDLSEPNYCCAGMTNTNYVYFIPYDSEVEPCTLD